jgi:hypothetical protein
MSELRPSGPGQVPVTLARDGARHPRRSALTLRRQVAEIVAEGDSARYKLKRRSDGSVLPALFVDDELREEKKRSMWWIA